VPYVGQDIPAHLVADGSVLGHLGEDDRLYLEEVTAPL
jgi:hypothetical protein